MEKRVKSDKEGAQKKIIQWNAEENLQVAALDKALATIVGK